jgi:hypothetical protein
MKKNKLNALKKIINEELVENLPIGFRNLEFVETNKALSSLKFISMPQYFTNFYVSTSHHKPISKCFK